MRTAAMHGQLACKRHGGVFETSPLSNLLEVPKAPSPLDNGRKPALPETGTTPAINYLRLGVAANLPSSTGRGGARNRADRQSNALTAAQIANLVAARHHANAISLPLNRMITIHWQAAGVAAQGVTKAIGHFLDLLSKMLARHGCRTAWLWIRENGPYKGDHCHILAHIPAEHVKRLSGRQRRWLRCITGRPYTAKVIHSDPIGGRLGLERSNPELFAVNLEAAFGYVCKGAAQAVLEAHGIERPHEPGGCVVGKRCGTSQNIGAKAREAKGR